MFLESLRSLWFQNFSPTPEDIVVYVNQASKTLKDYSLCDFFLKYILFKHFISNILSTKTPNILIHFKSKTTKKINLYQTKTWVSWVLIHIIAKVKQAHRYILIGGLLHDCKVDNREKEKEKKNERERERETNDSIHFFPPCWYFIGREYLLLLFFTCIIVSIIFFITSKTSIFFIIIYIICCRVQFRILDPSQMSPQVHKIRTWLIWHSDVSPQPIKESVHHSLPLAWTQGVPEGGKHSNQQARCCWVSLIHISYLRQHFILSNSHFQNDLHESDISRCTLL